MPDHPRMIKYYEDLLQKHGDHWSSLDWKSADSQRLRFEVLCDIFVMAEKPSNFSLLDIGCGFGDLYHFLDQRKIRCDYTGYDIAPRIIETARYKYPKAKFEVKDILNDDKPRQFDFVLCCGALNISFEEPPEHLEFIRSMLLRMFELCKIGVGVNFLSSQAIYYLPEGSERQPQYFYARPEDILGMAKGMTSRFIIRHDYHPGDFTVYLFK